MMWPFSKYPYDQQNPMINKQKEDNEVLFNRSTSMVGAPYIICSELSLQTFRESETIL